MPVPQQKRKMIGELLIAEGLITQEQLDQALAEQKKHGGRLGNILKNLGFVTEGDIIKVLGKQIGIQYVVLSNVVIDPEVIKIVPENLVRRHQLIPLYAKDNRLTVAMADPLNVFAIDDIRHATGYEIEAVVSTEKEILRGIDRFYNTTSSMEEVVKTFEERRKKTDRRSGVDRRKREGAEVFYGTVESKSGSAADSAVNLEALAEETPVIKLVNMVITQAVREGASDIHMEPEDNTLRIRYRVDGLLRDIMSPPKDLQAGIVSRIKIMADLDIAERRIPQDGHFQTNIGDKNIDVRISTLPTIHGEKIVMRLLDKTNVLLSLEDLGLSPASLGRFKKMITRPYGLLLVTGPTGSGKTTTLYAALNTVNSAEKNIVTIEDPVEYRLKGINQVQINTKVGMSFANGLRSILRQDPDIVMVGEIRDKETATIAIQAALTGHMVFSTLHTNDAPSAIARLIDMGVEPFLIASSITGILAQRLVRKVCEKCKNSYIPTSQLLNELNLKGKDGITFIRGEGCQDCRGSGYSGRIGVYELLSLDDTIRELTIGRAHSSVIRATAIKNGFIGLREDGLAKAIAGLTTVEEVLRVTQEVEE